MMGRQNGFYLLRLGAAGAVLWGHAFSLHGGDCEPLMGCRGGVSVQELGLYTFFTISGFLVTESWNRDPHIVRFLMRRVLRVFPGMAVAVLLVTFVMGPLVTNLSAHDYFISSDTWRYLDWLALKGNVTFLPGVFAAVPLPSPPDVPLWTLPTEVKLYGVLAICAFVGGLQRGYCAAVAIALSVAGAIAINGTYCLLWAYFAAGSLLCTVRDRVPFRIGPALVLAGVAAAFPNVRPLTYTVLPYVVLALALRPCRATALLERGGDLSYGIYLYAFPIEQLLEQYARGWPLAAQIPAAVLGAVAVASISWRWVERPALRWKPAAARAAVVTA